MKTIRFVTAMGIVFAAASAFSANTSATGGFHAGTTNIEFNARMTGSGVGQMDFSGQALLDDGSTAALTMKIDFDCVRIEQNHAAMSGSVRMASLDGYTGHRVILAVEDNGEGSKAAPDGYTFGVYNAEKITWIPSDAEVKGDDGWFRTWIASDVEREDDKGVATTRDAQTDCRSFSFATYEFTEIGGGNIQVRP